MLLAALQAACRAEQPATGDPPSIAPVRPTPAPLPTDSIWGRPADGLILTLPESAGGVRLESVQVVDPSLNVGHLVDDALAELGKERRDAVAVFRYAGEPSAMIGAIKVAGVDGPTLLEALVETWNAPGVVDRHPRPPTEYAAWELRDRGGSITVLYRRGDVVYLVVTEDRALLEAILLDTCCTIG